MWFFVWDTTITTFMLWLSARGSDQKFLRVCLPAKMGLLAMERILTPVIMQQPFILLNKRINTMPIRLLLLSSIVLFCSQCVAAWEVSCPAVINTQSSTVVLKSAIPAPWQRSPRYNSRLWLSSIGVTQGKPENQMDLKPETEKVKGEIWSFWKTEVLSDNKDDRYWVSCIYGLEQIWLAQPIPTPYTRCKTRNFEGSPEDRSVSFICE